MINGVWERQSGGSRVLVCEILMGGKRLQQSCTAQESCFCYTTRHFISPIRQQQQKKVLEFASSAPLHIHSAQHGLKTLADVLHVHITALIISFLASKL